MTGVPVAVTQDGGVRHLRLTDGRRRNPLSRAVLAEISSAAASCGPPDQALIISGGAAVFSAGADLTELTGTVTDLEVDDAVTASGRALRESDLLVVAAVEGACIGAAVDLVSNADVVVAARSAYFEVPAVRLGLLYNPESVARWHGRMPPGFLSRLLLAAERVDSTAAREAGLVAEVVEDGRSVDAARRIAARLAGAPRAAMATTKQMLRAFASGRDDPAPWQDERRRLADSPERAAALERRRRSP